MTKDIAVLIGLDGETASFLEPGRIKLYRKEKGKWSPVKELSLHINAAEGIKAVREGLMEAASLLPDVKTVVGREITGVPYHIFDAAGFSIFEAQGKPEDFLDSIAEQQGRTMEPPTQEKEDGPAGSYPVSTDIEGKYYINLKVLQISQPAVSSKKALLPFLKNEEFYELEVICSHIPPWFDVELDKLGLKYAVETRGQNDFKVSIYHKTCNE